MGPARTPGHTEPPGRLACPRAPSSRGARLGWRRGSWAGRQERGRGSEGSHIITGRRVDVDAPSPAAPPLPSGPAGQEEGFPGPPLAAAPGWVGVAGSAPREQHTAASCSPRNWGTLLIPIRRWILQISGWFSMTWGLSERGDHEEWPPFGAALPSAPRLVRSSEQICWKKDPDAHRKRLGFPKVAEPCPFRPPGLDDKEAQSARRQGVSLHPQGCRQGRQKTVPKQTQRGHRVRDSWAVSGGGTPTPSAPCQRPLSRLQRGGP